MASNTYNAIWQRYLDEFTFRYNNRSKLGIQDAQRAERAMQGGEGKCLTWRRTTQPKTPRQIAGAFLAWRPTKGLL